MPYGCSCWPSTRDACLDNLGVEMTVRLHMPYPWIEFCDSIGREIVVPARHNAKPTPEPNYSLRNHPFLQKSWFSRPICCSGLRRQSCMPGIGLWVPKKARLQFTCAANMLPHVYLYFTPRYQKPTTELTCHTCSLMIREMTNGLVGNGTLIEDSINLAGVSTVVTQLHIETCTLCPPPPLPSRFYLY
jgi:hypothetical protein